MTLCELYSVPSFVRDSMPSVVPSLYAIHCQGARFGPTPTFTNVPASEPCELNKTTSGLPVVAVTSRKQACCAEVGVEAAAFEPLLPSSQAASTARASSVTRSFLNILSPIFSSPARLYVSWWGLIVKRLSRVKCILDENKRDQVCGADASRKTCVQPKREA